MTRSPWEKLRTEALHPHAENLDREPIDRIVSRLLADEARAQRAAYSTRASTARAATLVYRALLRGGVVIG